MDFKDLTPGLAALADQGSHDDVHQAVKNLRAAAFAALTDNEARSEFSEAFVMKGDDEVADMVRHLTGAAPPPVVSVVLSVIRDAIGQDRYVRALRSAGLAHYLDVPYTGTGAELMGEAEERYV